MKKILAGLFLAISINSFSQQPIFATNSVGDLYSFDLANCTRHFIGSTGLQFSEIAFTPNGQLWGITDGKLFIIDTATARAALTGITGLGYVSLVGLDNNTLLAEYDKKLYSINTVSGASSYIDTIGFHADGDLTWYDDDLYMVTSGGQIIRMVLNITNTALVSITPIGSSVPTCEGAVTASFTGDYNSIVGFRGSDLIKICHIDGSSQMLCPNLNIGRLSGGASIRLLTQIPQPVTCSTTEVNEISFENQFLIFPNPAKNNLNIKVKVNKQFIYNIYNACGQLLQTGTFQSNLTTIHINNLCRGLYTVELISEDFYERQSFIVEN